MKLPNADKAVVEREKIVDYLLNPGHRYGASKARFFAQFGFRPESWEVLAAALRAQRLPVSASPRCSPGASGSRRRRPAVPASPARPALQGP